MDLLVNLYSRRFEQLQERTNGVAAVIRTALPHSGPPFRLPRGGRLEAQFYDALRAHSSITRAQARERAAELLKLQHPYTSLLLAAVPDPDKRFDAAQPDEFERIEAIRRRSALPQSQVRQVADNHFVRPMPE